MSHFYGTVKGGRTEASRCGHKNTGIRASAGSWSGGVEVQLYYDEETDTDMAVVSLVRWQGSGIDLELYRGPAGGPPKCSDVEEALRCKTCVAYKKWAPFTDGRLAKEPTAPIQKEV